MKKIVFFDLDGTLTDNPSSEKLFFYWLIKNRHIGRNQLGSFVSFLCRWLPSLGRQVVVKNKAYLKGLSKQEVAALAAEFTTNRLLTRIRPRIQRFVDEHLAAGDVVILLSGTFEQIAVVFAKHLGITEVVATQCVYEQEMFSDLPPKQHPYAAEKLVFAKQLAAQHGMSLQQGVAYANSFHDRFLLEGVQQAIAVTPDRQLRVLARQLNWQILE